MDIAYNAIEIKARISEAFELRGEKAYKVLPQIGLAQGTLDKANKSMPKADTLARIADYLGCSVDYLLGRPADGISPEEQTLLDLFRACSDVDRAQLLDLAKLYADREHAARSKRAE